MLLKLQFLSSHGVSEMNRNAARFVQFGVGLVALVALGWVVIGRAAAPAEQGVPTDWTHQHVIFSRPATAERARQVERDPRYWQQWYRQNIVRVLSVDGSAPIDESSAAFDRDRALMHGKVHRDWSEDMGAGATVGAGNYPAKYSFSISTANCGTAPNPDFVVFSTGLQSSASVASIVAYDNLYTGCGGTVPSTYWAYNTTTSAAGTIKTSPVFSLDGSQLAFVQTDGLHGTVVLLKWAAGTGTLASPATPSLVTAANYAACTAPCMTAFDLRTTLNVQVNDITSSVYYDYTGDVAWVGDSFGLLHQFHPFFTGTPAEIRTLPWPVLVNPTNPTALSSPVFDHVSGNVFIGDAGGYLESVSSTTGLSTISGQVDHGTGVVAPPVVDKTIGKVYVFASSNGVTNCIGTSPCAAVYQFSTSFLPGTLGTQTHVGVGGATNPMYSGGFDSAYRSGNGTGSLYVCGDTGKDPILYQIKISAGAMPTNGTFMGPVTSDASTAACSPVTDIPNPNLTGGAEERAFVSAQLNGRPSTCANKGCIIAWTNTPWKSATPYIVGQQVLASHIETVITAGTSGNSTPAWGTSIGQIITDGSVRWYDQGPATASPFPAWSKNTSYTVGTRIADLNRNVEVVTVAGTTGATVPSWSTTAGTNTTDNTVTYINAGAVPTSALQTASGTSGIVMDNTVGSGTLGGASQVYFSTLGNQTCTTSGGTGGCAVQASQSALK